MKHIKGLKKLESSEIIKDIIFDVLLKRVIEKVVTRIPFFAIPLINPIFIFVATKLLRLIYAEGEMHLAFTKIDVKINNEVLRYAKAKEELEQNPGDKEKRKEFENATVELISFN